MIVTLSGENDFLRGAELKRICADFTRANGNFGLERIDASETDFGRLIEVVASLPFLAARRMVIVHNLTGNKYLSENIEQFLDAVSDTTDLVLEQAKFDKRMSLYKVLKKRTEFREYAELDERGLTNWLVQAAKERGGSIKPNDAAYLVQRIGVNQMYLSNELDKLLSYQNSITKQTIDMLSEPTPQSSMFDLLDAAFAGNKQKTMALYEDQRKQQVEPQAIMGMLAWQLHVLAVVKFNEKDGAENIAKSAKLNPFVVRKTMNLTRNLSAAQVKDLVGRALRLDVRLKSENIDADDAVQHFLLTI